MKIILLCLIRLYQLAVSPLLGTHCRFAPSCSCYAAEALQSHGVIKGSLLAAWRLLRCQPFAKAGFDPVPEDKWSVTGLQSLTTHSSPLTTQN